MNFESIKKTFDLAVRNHKSNDFKKAEKLYHKILDTDSNHFESIFLLGSLYAQNDKLNLAKKLLEKAIKIKPDYADGYYNLGIVYMQLDERKDAIKCYEKTLQINPEHLDAYNNLGNLLNELGKIKEALRCYKKVIEINPKYVNAYNNIGAIFQKLKNFNESIIYYKKALKIKPNFEKTHNNLGLIHHHLENYQNAINFFEKSIKINPEYAEAHSNLGKVFKELGEFKKMVFCFENAIKYNQDDLVTWYYLSEVKKEIINLNLKKKIIKIIDNEKCSKINLAYGNFLLSKFELLEKNYENELNYLLKGHKHYYESNKDKFSNTESYWINIIPEIIKLVNLIKSNKNNKKNLNKIKPIFIIGIPRCGSTLIEKVIASGNQYIPIGEETNILYNVVDDLINKKYSLISDLYSIQKIITEEYDKKKLINKRNNYFFTDKSLENFFYLELIKEIFPNAKVINCKRDILPSIISIIKNNLTQVSWAHNLEKIFEYFEIYHNQVKIFKNKFPNFIYEIKYEKFVKNPELEGKKLFEFCNLEWNKKCLEFYKRKDLISKTASNIQIREPIYKNSSNRHLPYKKFFNKFLKKYSTDFFK